MPSDCRQLATARNPYYEASGIKHHQGNAILNLVLYQPDIPQNLGACLRLSACLGCTVHIVEPCGFPFHHGKLRRAGMDYIESARYLRHLNWQAFLEYRLRPASFDEPGQNEEEVPAMASPRTTTTPGRLFLLETDGVQPYTEITFAPGDYIVLGRESAGTPHELYGQMDATLTIPMRPGVRSLNVAMAAGMLVAEACRQSDWRME